MIPDDIHLAGSPFVILLGKLDTWYANMSSALKMNDLSMYIHKETNMLGPVFFLNVAYHAAVFDLTRISLYGFDFPLAAAVRQAPEPFQQECQRRCRHHADEVSRLIRLGLKHGTKSFDDPFCFTAAYEASKIQIVHATTISPREQFTSAQAEANIRTNTQLMSLMGRSGSSVHVRTRSIEIASHANDATNRT